MVAPVLAPAPAPALPSRFPRVLLRPPPRPFRSKLSAIAAVPRPLRAASPPPAPLPSSAPPRRRSNHLRQKLLKTLTPSLPHPVLDAPQAPPQEREGGGGGVVAGEGLVGEDDHGELQPPPIPLSHGAPTGGLTLVVEETEEAVVVSHHVGDQRCFFPGEVDVPRLLLELSVYLAAFLVVQTVCAIWLFGGAGGGEGKSAELAAGARAGKVEGREEVGEGGVEFERTVAAIQAMARQARVAEARKAAEKGGVEGLRGDIVEEVDRRVRKLRKRMPSLRFDAKALANSRVNGDGRKVGRTPAKGFNGSKGSAARTRDLGNGGSQQLERDGHFKKPSQLQAQRQSNAHGYSVSEKETVRTTEPVDSDSLKNSCTSGDLNASDQGVFENPRNDHIIGNDGTYDNPVSPEEVDDSSPFGEGIHHEQTGNSNKASGLASKTTQVGTSHSQSSFGKKHCSSSTYGNSYTNSEIVSDKMEHKHLHKKAVDSQSDELNLLWWLKLPYVLAIFLRRGSDRKEFRGLYSLKLDSSSEEQSPSHTVVFEDRVDATNFCYLLESFFEELDDFVADIVPLSVQEVRDAVKSRTLEVIVVRKGQLHLYVGQPLAEAEMQLRSMLD